MTNQEISLKWNGFQNNILCNVKELLKDEGLSDVTLVSGGQSFRAHKVILFANSLVFKSIFQQNPHKDPIIVLHDINTASLKALLTYMYNGEINVTEEFLPVLLKTADALKISGLSTGTESSGHDDEKLATTTQQCKKRKKIAPDESCVVPKKKSPDIGVSAEVANGANANAACKDLGKNTNIILKVEPIDSPLTDYSGENTTDTDIALLEDCEKKYSVSSDSSQKSVASDKCVKKWISEVSSTQPCLNVSSDKSIDCSDEDKDSVEIDKEVETVLQSGAIVESLSVTTDNPNAVSSEAQLTKEKTNTCYANPSFPCPFCSRIYNSWGYRRRHVKSRHMNNKLSCKWCVAVLPSTGAWYGHATRAHGVPHEEARNSLVVMVEAHAVLTLNEPSVAQLLGQVGMANVGEGGGKTNE